MLSVHLSQQSTAPAPTPEAGAFLATLAADEFTGVVELGHAGRAHYLIAEKGAVSSGFFCEQHVPSASAEAIGLLFRTTSIGTTFARYSYLPELPTQASPGMLNLYRRLIQLLTQELSLRISEPVAANVVRTAQRAVTDANPVVSAFEYGASGWKVSTLVATPAELRDAASAWMSHALDLVAGRSGIDAVEVLTKITRDDRFVLEEEGFYAALPFPVAF